MSVTSTSLLKSLGTSTIDTNELVTNLTNATKVPRQKLIDAEKTKATVGLSSTALLKSALATLESAAADVGSVGNVNHMSINSSDSSVVTASTSMGAVAKAGTYAITVTQLAKPQRTQLELQADALGASGSISLSRGAAAPTVISLANNATPADIVTAINNASAALGVKATLIDTQTTAPPNPLKVVIESATGASGAFNCTLSNISNNQMKVTTLTEAKNAKFAINDVALERSSNSVTGAISGLTLQLNSISSSSETLLTVTADTSGLSDKVKNLVDSYNMVRDFLIKATGPKVSGDDIAGSLQNNPAAKSILVKMRTTVQAKFTQKSTAITTWNALGVAFDRDGVLQFDSNKFLTAFQANRESAITALTNDAEKPYVYSGEPSGLAGDVAVLAHQLNKNSGTVANMSSSFDESLKRVEKKQTDLDAYIEKITAQYQKQFTAMDTLLAAFKDTQAQLTSTFNNTSSK